MPGADPSSHVASVPPGPRAFWGRRRRTSPRASQLGGLARSLRLSSLPWRSDSRITKRAKNTTTPREKKVMILSSVSPTRPSPLSLANAISLRSSREGDRYDCAGRDGASSLAEAIPRRRRVTLGFSGRVAARGNRPRDRAGADRVPADLEHRPPAHRARVRRLAGPGRRFHRRHPARDHGRCPAVLPRGPAPDLPRLAALAARPIGPRQLDARIGWYILLGTIPIGIFGVVFKDQIETGARDLYLIGIDPDRSRTGAAAGRTGGQAQPRVRADPDGDGVVIGLAQALALIPGVSRSGSTITAGLFMGLDRTAAARFSFLLSIPAVVLSGLLELGSILSGEEGEHVGRPGWWWRPCSRSSPATRPSRSCCATSRTTRPASSSPIASCSGVLVLALASAGDDSTERAR